MQLDGGVIGPVGVLDDDQCRWAGAERVEQAAEQFVAVIGRGETHRGRSVEERAEGARRDQRVAATEGDPGRRRRARGERTDERGLADPRLATDERDPTPALLGVGEPVAQLPELPIPLEQPFGGQLFGCSTTQSEPGNTKASCPSSKRTRYGGAPSAPRTSTT